MCNCFSCTLGRMVEIQIRHLNALPRAQGEEGLRCTLGALEEALAAFGVTVIKEIIHVDNQSLN